MPVDVATAASPAISRTQFQIYSTANLEFDGDLSVWTTEFSKMAHLRIHAFGWLEVPMVAPATPPSDLVFVKQVNIVMPTPTLDSRGRPM